MATGCRKTVKALDCAKSLKTKETPNPDLPNVRERDKGKHKTVKATWPHMATQHQT